MSRRNLSRSNPKKTFQYPPVTINEKDTPLPTTHSGIFSRAATSLYSNAREQFVPSASQVVEPLDNYALHDAPHSHRQPIATGTIQQSPPSPDSTSPVQTLTQFVRNYTEQGQNFVAISSKPSAATSTPLSKVKRKFNFRTPKISPIKINTNEPTVIPETPPKDIPEPMDQTTQKVSDLPAYRHRFIVIPETSYTNASDMEDYIWAHSECIIRDSRCGPRCFVIPTTSSLH